MPQASPLSCTVHCSAAHGSAGASLSPCCAESLIPPALTFTSAVSSAPFNFRNATALCCCVHVRTCLTQNVAVVEVIQRGQHCYASSLLLALVSTCLRKCGTR